MIETTFVGLKQAAAMLGTDEDTILLAASESRIQLYWLVNALLPVGLGEPKQINNTDEDGLRRNVYLVGIKEMYREYIDRAPLTQDEALGLLKAEAHLSNGGYLSDPDENGNYLVFYDEERVISKKERKRVFSITRRAVQMMRNDVRSLQSGEAMPPEGTVPRRSPTSSSITRSNDTKLLVINALCKKLGIDSTARGATVKVAHALELAGTPFDEGAIRPILKMIGDALARRADRES